MKGKLYGVKETNIASAAKFGSVKVDGTSIVAENGVISATSSMLATVGSVGVSKPDGNSIVIDSNGTLSAANFNGVYKVNSTGSDISIANTNSGYIDRLDILGNTAVSYPNVLSMADGTYNNVTYGTSANVSNGVITVNTTLPEGAAVTHILAVPITPLPLGYTYSIALNNPTVNSMVYIGFSTSTLINDMVKNVFTTQADAVGSMSLSANVTYLFIRIGQGAILTNFTVTPVVKCNSGLPTAPLLFAQTPSTIAVRSQSKNLLGLIDGTYSSYGIRCIVSDGIINVIGTATAKAFVDIPLHTTIKTGNYVLSLNNNVSSGLAAVYGSLKTGIGGAIIGQTNITKVGEALAFTSTVNCPYFCVRVESGLTVDFTMQPQVEYGTLATPYVKYQATYHNIPVIDTSNVSYNLNGLSTDYCDKVDLIGKKIKLNTAKISLTGAETVTNFQTLNNVYRMYIAGYTPALALNSGNQLCTHFSFSFLWESDAVHCYVNAAGSFVICIPKTLTLADGTTLVNTAALVKTWLAEQAAAGKPVQIVYALADTSKTEHTLSTTSIEALQRVKTYAGYTVLTCTDTAPAKLDVTEMQMSGTNVDVLLKNSSGNGVLPITVSENVIRPNGETVEQALSRIERLLQE